MSDAGMPDGVPESRVGTRFGQYELRELLGRGAMGEVYGAFDTVKERNVAVKLLPSAFARDPEYRERFRREAQVIARLNNPHVVPVHDFGEIDGTLFIEMVRVDGTDLATVLHRFGPMPPDRAVDVLTQVCDAVDTAHADGLVHRDIKPANIFVTDRGFAYLGDFGIATPKGPRGTTSGVVVGSIPYMAPERFTDAPTDGTVDIYSLGCVLHEMLSGRPAFRGSSVESLISAQINEPVAPLGGSLAKFDPVIAQATAKDPGQRFQNAGALARAARAVNAPEPVVVERPGRWRTAAVLATVIALIAVAGGAFALTRSGDAQAVQLLPANETTKYPFTATTVTREPGKVTDKQNSRDKSLPKEVDGSTAGIYGVTGSTPPCDKARLVSLVTKDPNVAKTWAGLQGIPTNQIKSFVDGLTPVVLRADTAVMNSDYRDGKGVKFPAILQAGTAVLVNGRGQPAMKCNCGNPLLPPPAKVTSMKLAKGSKPWAGYSTSGVRVIAPAKKPISDFQTVDVDTGQNVTTPAASGGQKDAITKYNFGDAVWRVPVYAKPLKFTNGRSERLDLPQLPETIYYEVKAPEGDTISPDINVDLNGDGYLDTVRTVQRMAGDDADTDAYIWIWDPSKNKPIQLTPAIAENFGNPCEDVNTIRAVGTAVEVNIGGAQGCDAPATTKTFHVEGDKVVEGASGSPSSSSSSASGLSAIQPGASAATIANAIHCQVTATHGAPAGTERMIRDGADCTLDGQSVEIMAFVSPSMRDRYLKALDDAYVYDKDHGESSRKSYYYLGNSWLAHAGDPDSESDAVPQLFRSKFGGTVRCAGPCS